MFTEEVYIMSNTETRWYTQQHVNRTLYSFVYATCVCVCVCFVCVCLGGSLFVFANICTVLPIDKVMTMKKMMMMMMMMMIMMVIIIIIIIITWYDSEDNICKDEVIKWHSHVIAITLDTVYLVQISCDVKFSFNYSVIYSLGKSTQFYYLFKQTLHSDERKS